MRKGAEDGERLLTASLTCLRLGRELEFGILVLIAAAAAGIAKANRPKS
jgi:hypothetical protein